MAFLKENGELNNIKTDIYYWLKCVHIEDIEVDTVVTNLDGYIDIEGNPVYLVDGNIPTGTELLHILVPSNEWTFIFLPYSSRDISKELRRKNMEAQGPPFIIRATEAKSDEWQIPAGMKIKEVGYNHPLLRLNIPTDWEDC